MSYFGFCIDNGESALLLVISALVVAFRIGDRAGIVR